MAIILNQAGLLQARQFIEKKLEVDHSSNNWKEHKATQDDEAKFLNTHSLEEYGAWFLGIDTDKDKNSKEHYVYPYGDFNILFKSALIDIEHHANQQHHKEVVHAVRELLALLTKK